MVESASGGDKDGSVPGVEQPRNLEAVGKVAEVFDRWGQLHGNVSKAAQNLDFVVLKAMPADTQEKAVQGLRDALAVDELPLEIRDIYTGLYGDVLDTVAPEPLNTNGLNKS